MIPVASGASGGTVSVAFAADSSRFTSELRKVRGDVDNLGGGFDNLKRLAGAAIAAFSVGALTSFLRTSAAAADQLGKTADKIGIGTERLAAFHLAAKDAGVELTAIDKLLAGAQKRLGEAAIGSGEAAKYIKALGLNVKELQKLSPDQLFTRYADSIATLENRSERMAAANALFGKSAEEAFNLIEAGRPAIDDAQASVDRYGLALSRIDTAKVELANDKIELLGEISKAAGQRIVAGLTPFISAMAESLLESTTTTEGLQSTVEKFGAGAYAAFQIVANAGRTLQAAFYGIAAAGARMLQAVTWGDVDMAFRASVDENLEKAQMALDKIQSIEQIQQNIVTVLEKSRAQAEAAVKKNETGRTRGTVSIAQPEAPTGFQFDADASTSNVFRMADQIANDAANEARKEANDLAQEIHEQNIARIKEEMSWEEYHRTRRSQGEEQLQQQLTEFKQAGLDAAISLMDSESKAARAIGKVAFAYQKGMAVAQAIIATKGAVLETYRKLGYPWGIPAAAAMAALGAAQIAAIVGTNPGAGSSAGSFSGGSAAAPSNPVFTDSRDQGASQAGVAQQRALQVHFNGPVYGMNDFRDQLVEMIREEVDERDVVIIGRSSRQAQELRG